MGYEAAASEADNKEGKSKGKEKQVTSGKASGSSMARPNVIIGGKPGPGRPPKADAKAYIDAMKRQYPPELVMQMMLSAWETADDTNSWRGKEAIIRLIIDSTVGKPVKRVESSGDTSLADLLANVDTSKPLLQIGSDNGKYHKLSGDGDRAGDGASKGDGSGEVSDDVSGDDDE